MLETVANENDKVLLKERFMSPEKLLTIKLLMT